MIFYRLHWHIASKYSVKVTTPWIVSISYTLFCRTVMINKIVLPLFPLHFVITCEQLREVRELTMTASCSTYL